LAKIQLLPLIVQNKIAAGEVVERPSAVVKELVENCIDAGATQIVVDLEEGGKKLIRVVDNGVGISNEDLILAVTQHATSKISSAEDLFSVSTMGFRGEALASIASVTHFVITSRMAGQEAYKLQVNGGIYGEIEPASAAVGTIIEARNLFFNTPVRLKFLKADTTELGKVNEILSCIALAKPEIGFHLTHNGKTIFQLPSEQSMADRIHLLLPLNLADELISLPEFDGGFFKLYGYFGSPFLARPRRDHQYMFVNGRVVKDKLLQSAVSKVYEGLIPNGKYPVVILFLEVEPSEVDVNVHPTKFEVRFIQSGSIFSGIVTAGKQLLSPKKVEQNKEVEIGFERHDRRNLLTDYFGKDLGGNQNPLSRSPQINQVFNRVSEPTQTMRVNDVSVNYNENNTLDILKKMYDFAPVENKSYLVKEHQAEISFGGASAIVDTSENKTSKPSKETFLHEQKGNIITIDKTFLIAQIGSELLMIDQHALHEKMQFETLKNSLDSGSIGSQQLLIPATLSIKETDKSLLIQHAAELERLGFFIEDFGPGVLMIRGVPADAPKLDLESFFHELIQNFEFNNSANLENARRKACATIACHSSVRAGDDLTYAEKEKLLQYAWHNRDILTCPHGRPALIVYSPKDFAKMFHR
jgi:DNA mismatch repair protein MutL